MEAFKELLLSGGVLDRVALAEIILTPINSPSGGDPDHSTAPALPVSCLAEAALRNMTQRAKAVSSPMVFTTAMFEHLLRGVAKDRDMGEDEGDVICRFWAALFNVVCQMGEDMGTFSFCRLAEDTLAQIPLYLDDGICPLALNSPSKLERCEELKCTLAQCSPVCCFLSAYARVCGNPCADSTFAARVIHRAKVVLYHPCGPLYLLNGFVLPTGVALDAGLVTSLSWCHLCAVMAHELTHHVLRMLQGHFDLSFRTPARVIDQPGYEPIEQAFEDVVAELPGLLKENVLEAVSMESGCAAELFVMGKLIDWDVVSARTPEQQADLTALGEHAKRNLQCGHLPVLPETLPRFVLDCAVDLKSRFCSGAFSVSRSKALCKKVTL